MRIVSLIASSTEIICALGLEDQLVGCSHECDFPESIKSLPRCSSPKFEPDGTSYEIDQRVKAILQEGLSVYRVDAEKLGELAPDFIVTQTQCEVCAVSLKDVEEATCSLIGSKPQIVSLHPNSLEDIWSDIRRVAEALAVQDRGEALVESLTARMSELSKLALTSAQKPRVACIEWIDPLMAAGNWMPTLVQMAGGENLFGEEDKHSPWMKFEELRQSDPDVILVTPCGFDNERTLAEMGPLVSQPAWKDLKAVRENRVYIADGNQFFNRPGPRVVESLEILIEIFHAGLLPARHEGQGWLAYGS